MSWEKVKLGDICESISDGDHLPPPKSVDGIPFVTISNVNSSNQFDFKNTMFVPQEYYEKLDEKRKPRINDILYSVVGSFGIPVFIKENRPFVFQRHIAILRPNESRIHPRYLYYKMLSKDFYMKADAVAIGAAQRTISLTSLRNMEISIPCKDSQKRIADILSAYDDLIENNQKQIKLLEEAAQRLYKQWFIDLRYPGHETTKIVDGLPEGWKTVQIQDVCKNIGAGGTPSRSQKTFWQDGNIDWFKTQELCDCWLFESSEKISEEGLKRSAAKMFPANGILMAIYASPTLGRLGILTKSACSNQAALCLQADESKVSNYWLYLKLFELRDRFNSIARGAGQQNISGIIVKETEITLPAYSVMENFTEMVKPFFEKQKILQLQNISLTQTRDRLLPKLMKNEI